MYIKTGTCWIFSGQSIHQSTSTTAGCTLHNSVSPHFCHSYHASAAFSLQITILHLIITNSKVYIYYTSESNTLKPTIHQAHHFLPPAPWPLATKPSAHMLSKSLAIPPPPPTWAPPPLPLLSTHQSISSCLAPSDISPPATSQTPTVSTAPFPPHHVLKMHHLICIPTWKICSTLSRSRIVKFSLSIASCIPIMAVSVLLVRMSVTAWVLIAQVLIATWVLLAPVLIAARVLVAHVFVAAWVRNLTSMTLSLSGVRSAAAARTIGVHSGKPMSGSWRSWDWWSKGWVLVRWRMRRWWVRWCITGGKDWMSKTGCGIASIWGHREREDGSISEISLWRLCQCLVVLWIILIVLTCNSIAGIQLTHSLLSTGATWSSEWIDRTLHYTNRDSNESDGEHATTATDEAFAATENAFAEPHEERLVEWLVKPRMPVQILQLVQCWSPCEQIVWCLFLRRGPLCPCGTSYAVLARFWPCQIQNINSNREWRWTSAEEHLFNHNNNTSTLSFQYAWSWNMVRY